MIAPKWESNHKAAGVIALITLIVHIYVIMCFHDYPLIAQVDAQQPAALASILWNFGQSRSGGRRLLIGLGANCLGDICRVLHLFLQEVLGTNLVLASGVIGVTQIWDPEG